MSTTLLEPPTIIGSQRPRILWVPPGSVSSTGSEAVDLAYQAGIVLDDWQAFAIEESLGERPDGLWTALEVAGVVPRQNGKGGILEVRELAGLFLISKERLIIHTAHEFPTSAEAFERLLAIIEANRFLEAKVARVSRSHGEEGIRLKDGTRIFFKTRTKKAGRGFSGDLVLFDEAMILPAPFHGALFPIMSARPNPQMWYFGSAVDQQVHEHGIVLARLRERGIEGGDPRLMYFEFSIEDRPEPDDTEPYTPDKVTRDVATDPEVWAEANPAFGIRITQDYLEAEQRGMSAREFAVERLGVGDWPATTTEEGSVIDIEHWRGLVDKRSSMLDPVAIAFDTTPNRTATSIAAAGLRPDGLVHGEVIEHGKGTAWVVDRLVKLQERHSPLAIICDKGSPAASLVKQAEDLGVTVTVISTEEYVQACGQFFDRASERGFRHLGTSELDTAVKGVATRPLGEAWVWSRRNSKVDISPLVAVTLAAWRAAQPPEGFFLY
jgi:phage terminase large subunit-like protein